MAVSTTKKGLYTLAGIIILLGGAWLGWQYYSGHVVSASAPQALTASRISAASQNKLIDEVLTATGLKITLEQLPEQFRAGVMAAPGNDKVPPAFKQAIGNVILDSLNEQNLRKKVEDRLKSDFDQKRMQAILDDFSTPLAKRMVVMETKTSTPQEQMAFMQELSSKPLSQARILAIQELDQYTHASELGTEIAMSSIKAMAGAVIGDDKDKLAKLDQTLAQQRSTLHANLQQAMFGSFAFTYRNVSDSDLTAYAKIYGAEHNQWLVNIVTGALSEGIQNASKKIGEQVVAMMQNNVLPAQTAATMDNRPESQATPQKPKESPQPTTAPPSNNAAVSVSASTPAGKKDVRDCLSLTDNRNIAKCVGENR